VLRKVGRLADAEPLYIRALAIAQRTHGPDHLEVARAQLELGDLVRGRGRVDEALALHQRALTILGGASADAQTWRDLGESLRRDVDVAGPADTTARLALEAWLASPAG